MEQDQWAFQLDLLCFRIRNEVWGNVPPVELHSLYNVQLMVHGLPIRDSDRAILANLLEGFCDHASNLLVPICCNGGDALDALWRADHRCLRCQVLEHNLHRVVHAALDVHRVHAGGHCLAALAEDGTGQDSGCGGPVTRHVVGLACNRLHELSANVDHGQGLELYGLRHGHAILGDLRCAERLLYDHIPALGAHGDCHGIGQAVTALEHQGPSFAAVPDVLG
mmetsp:Transcript_19466/g.53474  ORF Transcript_19466/g.53474 Transcript_19466/m.53474 type:complete len:223 (+) Transcript_19466:1226-1894(+)